MYFSTEQAYQHKKALYHSCHETARQIMSARTSAQTKMKARAIRQTESWHEVKSEVMWNLLEIKSKQCVEFREALIQTKGHRLIHNVDTDSYWGCGPDMLGMNMMGVLLEELREQIPSNINGSNSPRNSKNNIREYNVVESPTPTQVLKIKHPSPKCPPKSNAGAKANLNVPKQTVDEPPILIIGNSNARQMCKILGCHLHNTQSYCYPGGSIDYITSRIRFLSSSREPSHVILMVGDIEAANGLHPETIANKLECLVQETRRIFPWSRIIIVGLAQAGHPQRRHIINCVNKMMKCLAANFRNLNYASNHQSRLRDNIHLTRSSKTALCKSIAHIIKNPHLDYLQKF